MSLTKTYPLATAFRWLAQMRGAQPVSGERLPKQGPTLLGSERSRALKSWAIVGFRQNPFLKDSHDETGCQKGPTMSRSLKMLCVMFTLAAPAAQAGSDVNINNEPHILNSLLSASIGAMIADKCPSISRRKGYAFRKAIELQNYARRQGYSKQQIQSFLDDPVQQRRFKKSAEAYLVGKGVNLKDAASFCAAGRAEISSGTLAGRLIRQN